MSIAIEWRTRGGPWEYSAGYSSLEAAKTACCQMRKRGPGTYFDMDFRIYHDDSLYLVNAISGSWRLRWVPGNGLGPREQQP